jgi:dihydroorotase
LILKLVEETTLSLPEAIARVTAHPAGILGIDVGRLLPGAPADICIFERNTNWRVDSGQFISQGSNTPFDQSALPGNVKRVLVAGRPLSA